MKRRQISLIISLMVVALVGIIFLQVKQLNNALEIHQQAFQTQVQTALFQLVDELQRAEVKTQMVKVSRSYELEDPVVTEVTPPPFNPNRLQLGRADIPESGLFTRRIRIRDSLAIIRERYAIVSGLDSAGWEGVETFVYVSEDGSNPNIFEMRGDPKVVEILNQTISNLSNPQRDLPERLDSLQVDTLLRQALLRNRIDQAYQYMIRSQQNPQASLQSPGTEQGKLEASPHKVKLFPYLGNNSQTYLYLLFPDQSFYLFESIWVQALFALLFSAVIMVGFGFTIRTILWQKRLSEMKNDFINNMTHELKTPIATISLATDALNNPRIRQDNAAIDRYTGIIKEENQRMNRQVERVLQAARFNRQEITLKREPVDMNALIQKAAHSLRLQVQDREGQLHLDLQAPNKPILGDRQHLSNVISNLLDNANKYSPQKPQIRVRTYQDQGQFVMEVRDQGIGVSKSNQTQIFERFFRVSTGNLHEVKGFGLGLSYVKEVVDSHKGSIGVESTLGKGSTFTVRLPLES